MTVDGGVDGEDRSRSRMRNQMTPRSTARRGLADVIIAAAVDLLVHCLDRTYSTYLGRHSRRALFIRKARECTTYFLTPHSVAQVEPMMYARTADNSQALPAAKAAFHPVLFDTRPASGSLP